MPVTDVISIQEFLDQEEEQGTVIQPEDQEYVPADSANWDGDPSNPAEAIDRIAAAVANANTGSPIA